MLDRVEIEITEFFDEVAGQGRMIELGIFAGHIG